MDDQKKNLKKIHERLAATTGQRGVAMGQQAEGCGQEAAGREVWPGGRRVWSGGGRQRGVVSGRARSVENVW